MYGIELISGRNEKDVAQVEWRAQEVVLEVLVLARIQHFEQCGPGVTSASITAQLVDLV